MVKRRRSMSSSDIDQDEFDDSQDVDEYDDLSEEYDPVSKKKTTLPKLTKSAEKKQQKATSNVRTAKNPQQVKPLKKIPSKREIVELDDSSQDVSQSYSKVDNHLDDSQMADSQTVNDDDEVVAGDEDEMDKKNRRRTKEIASTLPLSIHVSPRQDTFLIQMSKSEMDLSGDMGAVGRMSVNEKTNDLVIDMKGLLFRGQVVPSNSLLIVNMGPQEARIESIIDKFIVTESIGQSLTTETVVEGTLDADAYDYQDDDWASSSAVDNKNKYADVAEGDSMDSKTDKKKGIKIAMKTSEEIATKNKPASSLKKVIRKKAKISKKKKK